MRTWLCPCLFSHHTANLPQRVGPLSLSKSECTIGFGIAFELRVNVGKPGVTRCPLIPGFLLLTLSLTIQNRFYTPCVEGGGGVGGGRESPRRRYPE